MALFRVARLSHLNDLPVDAVCFDIQSLAQSLYGAPPDLVVGLNIDDGESIHLCFVRSVADTYLPLQVCLRTGPHPELVICENSCRHRHRDHALTVTISLSNRRGSRERGRTRHLHLHSVETKGLLHHARLQPDAVSTKAAPLYTDLHSRQRDDLQRRPSVPLRRRCLALEPSRHRRVSRGIELHVRLGEVGRRKCVDGADVRSSSAAVRQRCGREEVRY